MWSMSPRPAPSRTDPTAVRVLSAAAELIDASLSAAADDDLPARLRSIHFPAALDWIRIEDIVKVAAAGRPPVSKKAILNRWATKDELVRDAAMYSILYRDQPAGGTPDTSPMVLEHLAATAGLATAVKMTAGTIVDNLLAYSRCFLLMHLAPMLPRHPEIRREIAADAARVQQEWAAGYRALMAAYGITLRPEWSPDRLSLQMLLDGYLLRIRVDPDLVQTHGDESASLFAVTAVTFLVGAIDHDGSHLSASDYLDALVLRGPGGTSSRCHS